MASRTSRILVACAAGIGWAALALPARAQDLDRSWVLVREDLDVHIDPELSSLLIEGSLVARLEGAESSTVLTLALNSRSRLMRFEYVDTIGAESVLNTHNPELGNALITTVRFTEPKHRGDEVTVSFVCQWERNGSQLILDESITLASWVEAWYPILPPQEGSSLGAATKVAGRTTFHMPEDWHAVTNGGLQSSELVDARRVEVWETERALSRSFAAAAYTILEERVNGLDVSLYLLSDDLPDPRAHVESLSLAIAALSQRWGPYPYPSYAVAEVPNEFGEFGASSEQGFILVKPRFLHAPGGNLPLFAHEASHAWWGNTIGSDGPGSLLCSETLAQYGAVIAAERIWGPEATTEFLRFSRPGYVSNQCARGYFELLRRGSDKPLSELVSGNSIDHTLSDAKGHWVLHMLRRRIGDERFFATLRGLIEEFTGRTMTLDLMRARFVEAAPDAGLERFFAQWLDRTGAPVLQHEWTESAQGLSLTIRQLQDGGHFELWLDVELVTDTETHRAHVQLTQQEQTFELVTDGPVHDVTLDPDHALLIWDPELGNAPVVELQDLEPAPLSASRLATYTGDYDLDEAAQPLRLRAESGQLTATLGQGAPVRLQHTGEQRFLSELGFFIFELEGDRAAAFNLVRHSGSTRRAVRHE